MPEHDISTPENYATRPTSYGIITVIIILTILSFVGILDDFAKGYVEETRNESIGIYALSRGINATVSLAQTTKIGELLDPINDAAERLSSAMAWAIGSLVFQEIILDVTSHYVFKLAFVAIGLAALAAIMLDRYSDFIVRIFIVTAIIRFIVPAFVIISCLASQALQLDAKIDKHWDELSWLCEYLPSNTCDEKRLRELKMRLKSKSGDLQKPKSAQSKESANLGKEIKKPDDTDGWGQYFSKMFSGFSLESLWDKFSISGSWQKIIDKSSDIVRSLTGFLAAIVIKNILLPLIFLAIALKCSLPIARYSMRLVSGLRRDAKELQGYIERGD